jgi:hypothetical protein
MKKLIGILFFVLICFYSNFMSGQVIATGAISNLGAASAGGDPQAGCDNGCNESALYSFYAPETFCNGTSYTGNYLSGWWPMQTSISIPSGCTINVVAAIGDPCNLASGGVCDNATSHCADSRADSKDCVGINAGFNNPGTTTSGSTGTGNIGTCGAGPAGLSGGSTLVGGATGDGEGCNTSPSGGNSNITCSLNGIAGPQSVTVWGMTNRGDEIITYTITATSGAGTCANLGIIVLPVDLTGLAAFRTPSGIEIKWSTITETNNDYFMVEYTFDGTNFIPYTKVKGAGNSYDKKDYTCLFSVDVVDKNPYFRLKQVDFNGNYKYSAIVALGTSVGFPKTSQVMNAYYDFSSDKVVSKFKLDYPQQVNISLYDLMGNKIQETSPLPYNEGDNEVLLNAPDKMSIYLLVYQTSAGLMIYKKLVVN